MDMKTEAFAISRVFDAPRDLVWKAWTEPERLKYWWGPKGFKIISCTVDLRPGGVFHYGMRTPEGQEMWGKFIYREIVRPERLVFVVSFSDEKLGVARHPWNPSWPLEMLSTVTFEAQGARTKITVQWVPHNATEIERKTFDEGRPSMQQGWTGTLDQFAAYLASPPASA
ncbi:MAG: SRPBCC domain-containing protein [Betaproteobacteria bacterium]|nr:SRPBCC domain-containing protein [Betaproteobacteria bacterium]